MKLDNPYIIEEVAVKLDSAPPSSAVNGGAHRDFLHISEPHAHSQKTRNVEKPLFVHSGEFVQGFVPPEYLIEPLMQRRFCYSWTAPTGHAKTLIALQMAMAVGHSGKFAHLNAEKGRVGYFAIENPDDVLMRWIALCDERGVEPSNVDVYFTTQRINIEELHEVIAREAEAIGGFDFIIIDTGSALFLGDDSNNDAQMIDHAMMFRDMVKLPGQPCVLVMMHPVKNPSRDNLIPKGGGGFLNQMDGNFTCWNSGGIVDFHWQGKLRGPGFEPIQWEVVPVTCELLKDQRGRLVPTVIAKALDDLSAERKANESSREQEKVLQALASRPGISVADIAKRYGWTSPNGDPQKSKVHRILKDLERERFANLSRNRWRITEKGRAEIKEPSANNVGEEGVE
jgi:DNA-binding MarR family transcriptional regulator